MTVDDFGPQLPVTAPDTPRTTKGCEKGEKRDWLKVWETAPPMMLNAHGRAKYVKLKHPEVWKELGQPQKTGASWTTEFHSREAERRGVAANRWLYSMAHFCSYQKEEETKRQHAWVLKETLFAELYAEIDRLQPSLEYCLAPKKQAEKKGSASLRASAEVSAAPSKDEKELLKHASILYEWLSLTTVSRIRMLMNWQAAGGLSFVASVHHLCATCFKHEGNSLHDESTTRSVSLQEFQTAILSRHRLGSAGLSDDPKESQPMDDYV